MPTLDAKSSPPVAQLDVVAGEAAAAPDEALKVLPLLRTCHELSGSEVGVQVRGGQVVKVEHGAAGAQFHHGLGFAGAPLRGSAARSPELLDRSFGCLCLCAGL